MSGSGSEVGRNQPELGQYGRGRTGPSLAALRLPPPSSWSLIVQPRGSAPARAGPPDRRSQDVTRLATKIKSCRGGQVAEILVEGPVVVARQPLSRSRDRCTGQGVPLHHECKKMPPALKRSRQNEPRPSGDQRGSTSRAVGDERSSLAEARSSSRTRWRRGRTRVPTCGRRETNRDVGNRRTSGERARLPARSRCRRASPA